MYNQMNSQSALQQLVANTQALLELIDQYNDIVNIPFEVEDAISQVQLALTTAKKLLTRP